MLESGYGYVDHIGTKSPLIESPMDNIEINFLKNPLKSAVGLGKKYLHRNSHLGRETIENPGSWKILDMVYGHKPTIKTDTFVPKHWVDKMFYTSKAAEATRARFKKYVEMIEYLGEEYAKTNNGKVDILSLASGPGRDIMEVMESLGEKGIDAHATCVDQCKHAMELGTKIAKSKGSKNIKFKRYKIPLMRKYENGKNYDIVITQGIMDYLSDKFGKFLVINSKELTKDGGTFITSNMDDHKWMRFWMEFFGGWKLNYRDGGDLKKIIHADGKGYDEKNIDVSLLSEGYHWIGIAKK